MSFLPSRPLIDAESAHYFVATLAHGVADPKPESLAFTLGRAIASRYDYLATWGNGRAMTLEQEAAMQEAIGVLRVEHLRLTGRAWIGE